MRAVRRNVSQAIGFPAGNTVGDSAAAYSNRRIFVHHTWVPGIRWEKLWGHTMRKVSLFVAALLVAGFAVAGDAAKSSASAQSVEQRDSFIRNALFPAGAKAAAPAAKKAAKKGKKKGKKAAKKK